MPKKKPAKKSSRNQSNSIPEMDEERNEEANKAYREAQTGIELGPFHLEALSPIRELVMERTVGIANQSSLGNTCFHAAIIIALDSERDPRKTMRTGNDVLFDKIIKIGEQILTEWPAKGDRKNIDKTLSDWLNQSKKTASTPVDSDNDDTPGN